MSKPPVLNATELSVYDAVINLANPKFPRTQTEVRGLLGISRSSVSACIKTLRNADLIRPIGNATRDILYEPYRHKTYMKRLIFEAGLGNGGPVAPYVPTVRAHLSGGALWFTVEQEGLMTVPSPDDLAEKTELFTDRYKLRGSTNHTGVIVFDGEAFGLRYMVTASKALLAVSPPEMCLTAEDMISENEVLARFALITAPVLDWLCKYDWRFLKEGGAYVHGGKLQAEYAFDEDISDSLHFLPEGVPGISPIFKDDSPGAYGPEGERETRRHALASAILTADVTKDEVRGLIKENAQLWAELDEIRAMLSAVITNQHTAVSYMVGVKR